MTTAIRIRGAGLTGTLRLTWVRDDLAHVIEHADTDEPTGTWIGSACPDYGLPIGSDVDLGVLRKIRPDGVIADLIWEAPGDLAGEHNQAHQTAMGAYQAGNIHGAEREWDKVHAIWSRAWAANCAAVDFIEGAGLTKLSPVKPQRWGVASFEHHCGLHGFQSPHIHNLVIVTMTQIPRQRIEDPEEVLPVIRNLATRVMTMVTVRQLGLPA